MHRDHPLARLEERRRWYDPLTGTPIAYKGGGGGGGTSTTTVQPWGAQKKYLTQGFKEASRLYGTPIQYYPGQAVAGFAPEQEEAFGNILERARGGSPLLRGAQNVAQQTLEGKYLTPESNPYLRSYYEKALEASLPQLDTSAVQAGRYGSGAWGQMRGRTMADLASGIYGPAYEAERGRQMQAMQQAPGLAREDYADMAKMLGVGEEKQTLEQQLIDEAMKKFEYGQLEPWERLGMYQQLVGGPYGGVTSTTSKQRGGGKF